MNETQYKFKGDPFSSHSLILAILADGRGQRLLDVGAADGFMAEHFTARGYRVTCVEANRSLAAIAKHKCESLIVADLDAELPKLEGLFDVIVCGDVLEHLKNPPGVLRSFTQLLKDDGFMIISVPNIAHLWVRFQLLLGRFEYADRGILDRTHLRFFTLASFRGLLQDTNLLTVSLLSTPVPLSLVIPARYHGYLFYAVNKLNALLARGWKSLFAYQFVAVVQKRSL